MSSTDPIADMLSRIRNAIAVNQREISLPYSKSKATVASILLTSGYLAASKVDGEGLEQRLQLTIWQDGASPKISEISRLSSPGRRLYASADKIPVYKQGRGMVVISTSKGMMSGQEARAQHLGGELICRVY